MSDEQPISPLAPETSPLAEADQNSLNELIQQRIDDIFNKPALLLSDDDLRVQIEYYRNSRARFAKESLQKEQKAKEPRGPKKKIPTSVKEAIASNEDLL